MKMYDIWGYFMYDVRSWAWKNGWIKMMIPVCTIEFCDAPVYSIYARGPDAEKLASLGKIGSKRDGVVNVRIYLLRNQSIV
jgi:hypothetical protein